MEHRISATLRPGMVAVLSLGIVSSGYAASFSDIAQSRNQIAIQSLSDKGVISGYSDGTFRPDATINRAELAKILVTASGANPSIDQYHDCFGDVTNEWFAPFVCYAKAQGWVAGYSDGTFRPSDPVNTAEGIKMVLNAQGLATGGSTDTSMYSDVDPNAWYAPYIATAHAKGLLQVTNGKLGIAGTMTRGLVAESIYRSLSIKASGAAQFDASSEPQNQSRNRSGGFTQQDLQQFVAQANAAPDLQHLTSDQFNAELATLRQQQMAQFQQMHAQQSGADSSRSFSFAGGQRSSDANRPNPLATATQFEQYTDPSGTTVLLALDTNGTAVFKWPRSFNGQRGSRGSQSSLQ